MHEPVELSTYSPDQLLLMLLIAPFLGLPCFGVFRPLLPNDFEHKSYNLVLEGDWIVEAVCSKLLKIPPLSLIRIR